MFDFNRCNRLVDSRPAKPHKWHIYWKMCPVGVYFLIAFGAPSLVHSDAGNRDVLLLNSYHKGNQWGDEVTRGIEDGLATSGYELHVEYLDTKRQFTPEYIDLLIGLLKYKHGLHKYRLILTSDDNAFDFATQYAKELYRDLPIVFCGTNYLSPKRLHGLTHVTGVNETGEIEKNVALIQRLFPDVRRITVIVDNTTTGQLLQKEVRRVAKKLHASPIQLELITDVSVDALIQRVEKIPKGDAILFAFFFRDKIGKYFNHEYVPALVARHAQVPVFGAWRFSLGYGIIGGYLTGGYYQGATAASMAKKILNGALVSMVKPLWKSPTRPAFDYRELKRWRVSQNALPKDAEIIHAPQSFYAKYKRLIWTVVTAFVFLVFVLVGVFYGMLRARRAERRLRELRNYLTSVIDSMSSILISVDTQGRITGWNAAAAVATGVSSVDAMGRSLDEVFVRLAGEMARIKEVIQTGQAQMETKRLYVENDTNHFEDITVFPIVADGIEGAVLRVDEITQRVKMEELMVQTEKMMSVGGLAAGMAHEINNPLAGILQNAQVIRNRLQDETIPANIAAAQSLGISLNVITHYIAQRDIYQMLDKLIESGRRASEIVTNMLGLARMNIEADQLCDITELLDESVALCRVDYNLKKKYDFKQIIIRTEYEQNILSVRCNPGKIKQVFINILKNGAEAMWEKKTNPAFAPTFYLRAFTADESHVRIEIADNGPGLTEEKRKRVFEPFFTSKAVDEGTGLGLSVSYFIITENHRGEMFVESIAGEGATFVIVLPQTPS
ncbi:MAG: PAS domain-containing protein [Deltaproteobacteria bacterium]|nr:PAS domain-containing protein [Deltaproteobacteria bacterium]